MVDFISNFFLLVLSVCDSYSFFTRDQRYCKVINKFYNPFAYTVFPNFSLVISLVFRLTFRRLLVFKLLT